MKPLLMFLAVMGFLHGAMAQPVGVTATNQLVFPLLLSTNESPLMTNAEFRCTQGIKVFFRTTDGSTYENFDATEIDSNQLAQMGLDVTTLQDAQTRLQDDRTKFAQEEAAGQAAVAAAQAQEAAQQQAQTNSDQGTNQAASSSSKVHKKTRHRR